jgi:vitamin B12 transporter
VKKINFGQKALLVLLITGTLLPVGIVSAEEESPSFSLDQIVVTASRLKETEFAANANINVITREQIEKNHYSDLTQALQTVPGVSVTRYGGGAGYEQSEGVTINGTSQILVLIDGTRANMNGSTFSVFSFGAFKNLDNVERIEILKGSASTLYGSDAKGGVINIITKDAGEQVKNTLTTEVGNFGKQQYRYENEGTSGNTSWVIGIQKDKSGNYQDGDGLETPSDMDATTFNLKLKQKLDKNSDLTFMYDRYVADYMYSGTNFKLTQRHYGTANNYNLRAIHNYNFNDGSNNKFSIYSQNTNTDYDNWSMDLTTIGFSDQYTKKLGDAHTLVAGVDVYQEKINDYDDVYTKYSDLGLTNKSVFLQDSWDMTKALNLTAGVRYDNHSKAGGKTSPSATLDYKFSDKTHMFVGYKSYFVAPNQYQYFSPYGNDNLKPESGHEYDFGIHHAFDDTFTIRAHVFQRKAKDVIAFAYGYPVTESNPYGGRYINVDEETAKGWDIQLEKKMGKAFNATVGYTHTKVTSQPSSGAESDNYYIPNGEWHIGLGYSKEKLDAAILGHGVIDRPGEGNSSGAKAFPCDTYWVWDASVNYKITSSVKLFVKANNIFDKLYAEHSNVKWGSPNEWYTSPGRNFVVGLQYSF